MASVASRSVPGRVYEVVDGVCPCSSWTYRKRCRHVAEVEDREREDAEQMARAQAGLQELRNQRKKEMVTTFQARKWDEDSDGNGEFAVPQVDDGTYPATIVDVDDKEFTSDFGTQRKWLVKWEIAGMVAEGTDGFDRPVTLIQFVTIPQGLIDFGYVHPKSGLYQFLKGLGQNPDADSFIVDPLKWCGHQGMIWVLNRASKKRPDDVRPQIVNNTLPPQARSRPATRPVQAPARRSAPVPDDVPENDWGGIE